MRIGSVSLPEALVEAHASGDLVLFIGAGASVAPPSSLPTFGDLARLIAEETSTQIPRPLQEHPDKFLDVLSDTHPQVHRLVADRLGAAQSKPNGLHTAIAQLACASPLTRVVTTNYDRHLATELRKLRSKLEVYAAPALPLGDDFSGLVYVHGSVDGPAHRLVLTRTDFGHAYLVEAYSARFLERMFRTYVVLFIGYSHNDVVMQYMARALGSSARRYALVREEDAGDDWAQYGVEVVTFRAPGDDYGALEDALTTWATRSAMGLYEHSQRIATMSPDAPPTVPSELDYAEQLLRTAETVRLLRQRATGEAWLDWLGSQPVFTELVKVDGLDSPRNRELAYYFADAFASSEQHWRRAHRMVAASGSFMSAVLCLAIGHMIHAKKGLPTALRQAWCTLMLQQPRGDIGDWLAYELQRCVLPDDHGFAMYLFLQLLRPRVATKRYSAEYYGSDVVCRGDTWWLRKFWTESQSLLVPAGHLEVVFSVAQFVRDLHTESDRLSEHGVASAWLSDSRAAIEPDEQDSLRDPIDLIIDVLRDSSESVCRESPALGQGLVALWSFADSHLLRRMAVHLACECCGALGINPAAWLADSGLAVDEHCHHEVFRLLENSTASEQDSQQIERIVRQFVESSTSDSDQEMAQDLLFRRIGWVLRYYPGCRLAQEVHAKLVAAHPDWSSPPHGAYLGWHGDIEPETSPWPTREEFRDLLQTRAMDAVALVESRRDARRPFATPSWHDALHAIQEAIERDGSLVCSLLVQPPVSREVFAAAMRGLSSTSVTTEVAERVLRYVMADPGLISVESVVEVLSRGRLHQQAKGSWSSLAMARELARQIRQTATGAPVATESRDWMTAAVNRGSGKLAMFWIHAVEHDWKSASGSWSGLTTVLSEAMEDLIQDPTDPSLDLAPAVILASQLRFLYAADATWTSDHILPLFRAEAVNLRLAAWDGFLHSGYWTEELLEAGLLREYVSIAGGAVSFGRIARDRLTEHLAGIAAMSQGVRADELRAITAALPAEDRSRLQIEVARLLRQMPVAARDLRWVTHLRQYWQARLTDAPVTCEPPELGALASWAWCFREHFVEAVQLAVSRPAGLDAHAHNLDIPDDSGALAHPDSGARLMGHLLTHTAPPLWNREAVTSTWEKFASFAAQEVIKQVREANLKLELGLT